MYYTPNSIFVIQNFPNPLNLSTNYYSLQNFLELFKDENETVVGIYQISQNSSKTRMKPSPVFVVADLDLDLGGGDRKVVTDPFCFRRSSCSSPDLGDGFLFFTGTTFLLNRFVGARLPVNQSSDEEMGAFAGGK
ncbi:hypothetical protein QVD17_10730 [Tagetes erecta]|uniref:Uncharacterized protein n=1 Tax=Tagetes erecta TaxID=13708 RepID=A0AAD8L3I3_TARER|nr:hypothetical protein QVD17_10730 [Tagetes erecta]